MATVTALYRHPVKALGAEALDRAILRAGETLPGDRVWALAHARSDFDFAAPGWARCSAFLRGATFPSLMAVTAQGAPGGPIRFRHPDLPDLIADLATAQGAAALLAWADALIPAGAPRPSALAAAPGRGMTDHPEPLVTVLSDASRRALEARAGLPLARRRFRGNIWMDGMAPWAERDLIGRDLRVGAALLRVTDHVGRCSATHADPATGRRDADLLAVLRGGWGHEDFGVFAEVIDGGAVALGDAAEVA